ncbi:PEP/pyruvate-binding domain-containing protein [Candidatus Riflebacteria bacterium]
MVSYGREFITDRFYFDDPPFETLMQNRVIEILLVCSNYDRFILEQDGRIDEQLFQEYVSLGLRYPPCFTVATTADEALALLERRFFDMVITMLNISEIQTFEFVNRIKQCYPNKPLVILTSFSREISLELEKAGLSPIQYVFSWLGNANILLAIVKLIEDQMNVEHDVNKVGVQAIILVENSVRYYSSYLPIIYRILFEQARALMQEGLNEHQQTMRMRGRPKILLATDYEKAVDLYECYQHSLLGVISDISYKRKGKTDPIAGLALCRRIRRKNSELPILLQSEHQKHSEDAKNYNAAFICKHSKSMLNELRSYIQSNFGFGDFVFRMPGTLQEIDRASDLMEFQHKIQVVPIASLKYHAENHHLSKWLKARALYPLANIIKSKTLKDFDGIESLRQYLLDTIKNYRLDLGRGIVADFDKDKFDEFSVFQRIGNGSLGGKARGIAFINTFLKRNRIMFKFNNVVVQIPKTVVLTTEVFERFMETNNLYEVAFSDLDDEEILGHFLRAKLPEEICEDLKALVIVIRKPLAVRSSSLLEDSSFQAFAGVYTTFLIPNNNPNVELRLRELYEAIKGVYASTYYSSSKSYAFATQNLIEEERMAVIIQEATGTAYGDAYYPNISGVSRSLNFYPIERELPEQGVVNVALGLGKTVVDGQASVRFSPAYPKKLYQLSNTDIALKSTQQKFYAINLAHSSFQATTDEAFNLLHLDIKEAALYKANMQLLSTYDFQNHTIRDGTQFSGRKVVTFAPILKYVAFPLAEIIQTLLKVGSSEMNVHVEIEFAVNLDVPAGSPKAFKFLQIRPIVEGQESEVVRVSDIPLEKTIITATNALGNGIYKGLHDFVYVKPESFSPIHTKEIVCKIDAVNSRLRVEDRYYILVGPGRWGTTDPWLGIPVKWPQITNARVIVEASLQDFRVDASQGSHFFQNLTSFRIAYLTINPSVNDGTQDLDYLNAQPALYEDEFLRHLRFDAPLILKIDGRAYGDQIKAIMLKPSAML